MKTSSTLTLTRTLSILSLSILSLGILIPSLGGLAHANGPKTPIDALNRLQSKRLLRRPTVSGGKLLLQMSATPGPKGKVDHKSKPVVKNSPLLKPAGTTQLLRGQKVSFCAGGQCDKSLRDAARRFGGKHTVTTAKSKTKVETKPAGFFGRMLERLSDLISGL